MTDAAAFTWILRWDTDRDVEPRVLRGSRQRGARGDVARMDGGGLVAFDGYLFDRAELQGRPEDTDAVLVAEAYRRWGDGLFDKLRGVFTLAVWDSERRLLLAGRDAMGLGPCFYVWDGRTFLLSSSLHAILAESGVTGAVDRIVVAEYLQNTVAPHQAHETFYEGVRRLPSAHALSLDRGRLVVWRYWDPVPPGFAWASPEEASQFPERLERAVQRCLAAGADCLALSGGFDSIGLAALAAEHRAERPSLHALSLGFAETECDESERQVGVARALGMPMVMVTVTESLAGRSLLNGAFEVSRGSHCPVLSVWQPLYSGLLRAGAEQGLSGLMMGTGGDDLLCVDLTYAADCLGSGDLRRLRRFYGACRSSSEYSALRVARAVFWHGAVRPTLRRLAAVSLDAINPALTGALRRRERRRAAVQPWLSRRDPGLVATLRERQCNPLDFDMAPGEGAYVRVIRHLSQAPMLQAEMEQGTLFTRSAGFSLFLPYYDRDVVDLLLRVRPEELTVDGHHKGPLRRLVGQRLPMIDTRARKVGAEGMVHRVLRVEGPPAWRDLGGPRMLAALDLVDSAAVERFMQDYFARRNDNALQAWLFLSAEMWLQARAERRAAPEEDSR
jgi:asparagine synthetase B (glutamine-hydrolysing)